jgi:hypothetical protein
MESCLKNGTGLSSGFANEEYAVSEAKGWVHQTVLFLNFSSEAG